MKARLALLALSTLNACGPPVPAPESGQSSSVSVRFEPSADNATVTNVTHLHVSDSSLGSGAVFLFEGSLSSYYLGKLKSEPLPDTLLSRQVPVASWRAANELVVAPLRPLAMGHYALASAGGLVTEFTVSVALPVLQRVWPSAVSGGGPRFAVYCAQAVPVAGLPSGESIVLEPSQLSVPLEPGVDAAGTFADRCLHFAADAQPAPNGALFPPPVVGAWALTPGLFSASDPVPITPLTCQAEETGFGLGCAAAMDDRVEVRTPDGPLLWIVHTDQGALVQVTDESAPLIVPGLAPDTAEHLWGSARDTAGVERAFDLTLHTAAARERPVLTEALADALGPEPQSEWLELFNDGTLAVDLAQYSLRDSGGSTPLPHASVGPKSYALLVREDYAPNASDEPPAPGTPLIRVPSLGKSGLSNNGERLALLDRMGQERSVLPALSGKAGQSLARRTPASPDADPNSFSFGVPTPGAPNVRAGGSP